MFDLHNWSNPETLGLNLTNAALGLCVLAAVILLCWKAYRELHVLPARKTHGKH